MLWDRIRLARHRESVRWRTRSPVDPPATMAVPKPESFSNEGTGILSSLNGKTETAMLWHDARAAARSKRTISRSRRADP